MKIVSMQTIIVSALINAAVISSSAIAQQSVSYTYNNDGKVLTQDGPRTDVNDITAYEYENGNRTRITNALGHQTQLLDYNGRGQPERIIDANGVETLLTYHVRGWLETITVVDPDGINNQVTQYTYDNVGQVKTVTLPNGSVLTYDYDGSRRLTDISNNLGERITYQLDNAGNRTKETITDNGGNIRYTVDRQFDELSRVMDIIGAEGQTTHIDYDVNNNPEYVTDARTSVTRQVYDPLDRLKETHDPENSTTTFGYDDHDRLTRVTDANQNSTYYHYDAYGNLERIESPDTGTTTYEYDEANNRKRMVDSRNIEANYTYDALNRLTTVTYPSTPEENVTYSYDDTTGGNAGIGRLTRIDDQSGNTQYHYNHLGQLTQKTATVNGQDYLTQYSYENSLLKTITYPSGLLVRYEHDTQGRIQSVGIQQPAQALQPLVDQIDYMPFGPIDQIDYSNGLSTDYIYNQDYRLSAINSAQASAPSLLALAYNYDPNGNIRQIDYLNDPSLIQAFEYDLVNRLTNSTGEYGILDFDYDPVGNRLSRNQQNGTDVQNATYNYLLGSNQLSDIDRNQNGTLSQQQYTYDAKGNPIDITTAMDGGSAGNAGSSYQYNAANRLASLNTPNGTAMYVYNALGQRVSKTTQNGDTGGDPNDGSLLFTQANLGPYGGNQDKANTGAVTIGGNGTSLTLQGNRWQALMLNSAYTLTSNTVLEVDVISSDPGEVIAVGFETDDSLSADRFFQFAGSQNWGKNTLTYTVGQSQRLVIPVGQVLSGSFDRIAFAADDDADASTDVQFSNLRLYENTPDTDPNPNPSGIDVVFTGSTLGAYAGNQDDPSTGPVTIENGGTGLNIEGNRWQRWMLPAPYTITADTVITFDVQSSDVGEIMGIGLETDDSLSTAAFYQLAGSQNWADKTFAYTGAGDTQRITLPVGQTRNGDTFDRLAFAADDDANKAMQVRFSNIRIYEATALTSTNHTTTANAASPQTQYFVYSEGGQLMGEYSEQGSAQVEYIWLNGQPLAQVRGNSVYTYHNDHLGTPRVLTDTAGNKVWEATYTPFGEATLKTDMVENNVRFPGQYFDQETQLHYNYFRYYDPSLGRYTQPDPIGLLYDFSDPQLQVAIISGTVQMPEDGFNVLNHSYNYALQNPLIYTDFYGLMAGNGNGGSGDSGIGCDNKDDKDKKCKKPKKPSKAAWAFYFACKFLSKSDDDDSPSGGSPKKPKPPVNQPPAIEEPYNPPKPKYPIEPAEPPSK